MNKDDIVTYEIPICLPESFGKKLSCKIEYVHIEKGMKVNPEYPIVEFVEDLNRPVFFRSASNPYYRLILNEGGVVTSVNVAPGDHVSAGDQIATMAVTEKRGAIASVSLIDIFQAGDWSGK